MSKTKFYSTEAAYPTASCVDSGHMVFASALAVDEETLDRVSEATTPAEETRIVLQRIEKILAEAGCTLRDIVKATVFFSDESFRFDVLFAFRDYLAPGPFPSRGSFGIGLWRDCRVQIDVIAVRS
jgi:2-iminobutanoate/2-iminopropanoate deaminase